MKSTDDHEQAKALNNDEFTERMAAYAGGSLNEDEAKRICEALQNPHSRESQFFSELRLKLSGWRARPRRVNAPVTISKKEPVKTAQGAYRRRIMSAALMAALLGVLGAQLVELERVRELITKKSQAVLLRTENLSDELYERRYMIHEFGGGASSNCREFGTPSTDTAGLQLSTERRPEAKIRYAGVNLFGNDSVTGYFDPIDLAHVKELRFEFRYSQSSQGHYALKLKNFDNDESEPVVIAADGQRGEWQTFVLNPREHEATRFLTQSDNRSTLIANISIYTDDYDAWGERGQIELRGLNIEMEQTGEE